jgi:hypothetical protein
MFCHEALKAQNDQHCSNRKKKGTPHRKFLNQQTDNDLRSFAPTHLTLIGVSLTTSTIFCSELVKTAQTYETIETRIGKHRTKIPLNWPPNRIQRTQKNPKGCIGRVYGHLAKLDH